MDEPYESYAQLPGQEAWPFADPSNVCSQLCSSATQMRLESCLGLYAAPFNPTAVRASDVRACIDAGNSFYSECVPACQEAWRR